MAFREWWNEFLTKAPGGRLPMFLPQRWYSRFAQKIRKWNELNGIFDFPSTMNEEIAGKNVAFRLRYYPSTEKDGFWITYF